MLLKKWLTMFTILFLLFSLTACKIQLNSPPSLKILYQDRSIDAKTGTYSWYVDNNDGSGIGIERDEVAYPELVKNSAPLTVSPESSLTLSFSDKPEDIVVNVWQDNKPVRQSMIDDKIVTSGLKGSVIYEVIGTWEQGTVHYAFSVKVE